MPINIIDINVQTRTSYESTIHICLRKGRCVDWLNLSNTTTPPIWASNIIFSFFLCWGINRVFQVGPTAVSGCLCLSWCHFTVVYVCTIEIIGVFPFFLLRKQPSFWSRPHGGKWVSVSFLVYLYTSVVCTIEIIGVGGINSMLLYR